MHIEVKSLEYLKLRTKKKLGKEVIRMSDCESLSKLLENELKLNVSAQSLRRFFGLIKYDGGFSAYTLDALARFCGFENYSKFKKEVFQHEMAGFFSQDEAKSEAEFWKMGAALATRIGKSPALLVELHHNLLTYPLARQFFLEHHPLRDMAATVYAQYFHEYLKYNQTNEAKLFAYGFLYVGAFLCQNNELSNLYFLQVQATPLTPEVHVLPAGRKFGVILLHADHCGDEKLFNTTYDDMVEACVTYREASQRSVCSFEYTVLEHLIFTDRKKEITFLIENNTPQLQEDLPYVTASRKKNHLEIWNILCAYAYHKMGEREKAQEYLMKTKLELLEYGWKKYYTILYLFVKYDFVHQSEKSAVIMQLQTLVDETYFSYFQAHISELQQDISA